MKRVLSTVALIGLVSLTLGCSGLEYMQRSQKPNIHSYTKTEYEPQSYEVLGPIEAVGKGMSVLGVFAEGEDGQGLLMAAARAKYGDQVTGLKDITSHSEWLSVLGFVFSRIETTYHAVAVKEN